MSGTVSNTDNATGLPDGLSTAALAKVPLALVLTNPHLEDNPIVYANRAFAKITGYSAEATIGRNCRFLQGDETDPTHAGKIGDALRDQRDISIDIVNYRADGSRFLNRLMITPLYDDEGRLQCFLGVQRDMSDGADTVESRENAGSSTLDSALGEIQHRVKNHLAMIIGMIRMQARSRTSEESFHALARRIESLQLLYQEMTEAGVGSSQSQRVPLGAYVSRVASTIGYLDGRKSVRVNVDCDAIEVSVERAARIGLLFSELLTNALKHAFAGRDEGLVEARLKMLSSGVIRLTVTDDGIGLPAESQWPYGSKSKPKPVQPEDYEQAEREAEEAEIERAGETVQSILGQSSAQREPNLAREIADTMQHRDAEPDKDEAETKADGNSGGSAVVDVNESAPQRARATEPQGGLGGRITVSLVRGLEARLSVNSATTGTTVTVDIPPEAA